MPKIKNRKKDTVILALCNVPYKRYDGVKITRLANPKGRQLFI